MIIFQVESSGLSASDSDTPPSDSDTPPQEQIAVISLPLVRTLHHRHRPNAIPLHTGHNQLSSDGGDFQWHTNEPLLLANRDENPETKAETRAQIESNLESSMPCKNLSATNLIASVDVSDNTSDGQSTQPSFDAVDVDMNSSEISLTKIKQELNNDSWNEQSGCDGYAPGDSFRNYTMPQGAWDFSSSHTLLKVTDSSQVQNHFDKIALAMTMNPVDDPSSMLVGSVTATSTPQQNWTWCRLCKRGTRNLEKHMAVCQMSPDVAGQAKFSCSKCQRLFKTRSYLIDHERSFHSNVPSYECCQCRRMFKYRMQLKRHKVHCVVLPNDALPPPCS